MSVGSLVFSETRIATAFADDNLLCFTKGAV